jgi:energy-coupling factor transport system permease protein
MKLGPVPATLTVSCIGAAALLAHRLVSVAVLAVLLLAVVLLAPAGRRWPYLLGAISSGLGIFLVWPLVTSQGTHVLWSGPTVPVLGRLDVTSEELQMSARSGLRLTSLALAFAAYALLVDHDRLLASVRLIRRSALMAVLATRLLPTLERDAHGFVEALRGRGVAVSGLRGHARLVSPLIASSLERSLRLAESMEARGFGRAGGTRAPRPPWTALDWSALASAGLLVVAGALWL